MPASRWRRSFSRQLRSSVAIEGERSRGSAPHAGSLLNTDANVSLTSSPSNARLPVSISKSTHPNAQMSLRASASRPFACSGAMYAAVPSKVPTPVTNAGDVIVGDIDGDESAVGVAGVSFANPKSSTLVWPSAVSATFEGFRSR
jgi:hypothetical protein